MTDYRDTPRSTRAPLPPALEKELRRQLEPGEQVVWTGQPQIGWTWRSARPLAGFALGWYAFLTAGVALAWDRERLEALVCLAPLALGGLMPVSAVVSALWTTRRAFYAVTDRRCIVHLPIGTRSLPPEAIFVLRLRERENDGDVVLAIDRELSDGTWVERPVGFLGIADARAAHAHVERLLRDALQDVPAQPAEERDAAEPQRSVSPARRR